MVQARRIDNCRPMFPGRFRGRFVSARQNLHKFLFEWSHRFCYSSPVARKMAEMMLRIANSISLFGLRELCQVSQRRCTLNLPPWAARAQFGLLQCPTV
jgi:hypothetical protein